MGASNGFGGKMVVSLAIVCVFLSAFDIKHATKNLGENSKESSINVEFIESRVICVVNLVATDLYET